MSIELAGGGAANAYSLRERALRRLGNIRERLAKGLVSDSVHIGLRRPVLRADEIPPSPIPLSVRRITADDVAELLPPCPRGVSRVEQADIAMRRMLFALLPESGFAVIDETSGRPCFLQWLIGPDQNDKIARLEGLPPLEPHQLMAEGAYVPPAYRGQKLGVAAVVRAFVHAGDLGAREIVTFVGEANVPSVKGAARIGFKPYMLHVRRHLLFGLFAYDRFLPMTPDHPRFAGKFGA